MGSIRLHPDTAAIAAAFSVEPVIPRYPCSPVQQPPRSPQVLLSTSFRSVEFRRQSPSSGTFAGLSRRFSSAVPSKLLSSGPRSSNSENSPSNSENSPSYSENLASNSDDGALQEPLSPESASGSQSGAPYVPGGGQQKKKKISSDPKLNATLKALERAAVYKKLKKLTPASPNPQPGQSPAASPAPKRTPETVLPPIEIIRGQTIQSRLQSSDPLPSSPSSPTESSVSVPSDPSSDFLPSEPSEPSGSAPSGPPSPIPPSVGSPAEDGNAAEVQRVIEDKMGRERGLDPEGGTAPAALPIEGKQEKISLAAFEKAKAYKQQQTEMVAALREQSPEESSQSSAKGGGSPNPPTAAVEEKVMEIEIVTRDGVIKRKVMNPEEQTRAFSNIKDVKRQGVSGIDFAGLGFADKKTSGRPAGLSAGFVAPPSGALPQVEILTRDAGSPQTEQAAQDAEQQLYKPRVSTWGLFPRPADISKAYGGGRTIRPGESLETEEERKIREERTQKLLADYRKKRGLDVDPKIKAEADRILRQGDGLMDNGRLREALPFYEAAMNKMPAQSELHGRAALQAAVCLDSLSRYDEARQVYEKLLAHPNGAVSKQARRFLFGFTAMEKLKVDGGHKWDTSLYRKYFDSFADGYNSTYKAENGEETSENLLPYALLLLCPILLVFALAATKSS